MTSGEPKGGFLSGSLRSAAHEAVHFRGLTWSFAQRELAVRYKHTLLGWVWSLIAPLATFGVYAVVFGLIFKTNAPGLGSTNQQLYPVWLICGLVSFGIFSSGVLRGIEALLGAGPMMQKVHIPPSIPVLGAIVADLMQRVVEIVLVLIVLLVLGNVSWTWLLLPMWAALFMVFTTGVALVCAIAAAHARDVVHVATVFMQFAFFATPVIYPPELVPADALGGVLLPILEANPLTHFVATFRDLTYGLVPGHLADWAFMVIAAGVALAAGAYAAQHHGRDLAERL